MKKLSGFMMMFVLLLLLSFGLAACGDGGKGEGESKEIKITVSQSGDTDGIAEYTVTFVSGGKAEALTMGDNTLTVTERAEIKVFFKLSEHYEHTLKINGQIAAVSWLGEGKDGAQSVFSADKDTTIDLSAESTRHKVTVKIDDNSDGLSGFGIKYKGQLQSGDFEMFSNEAFEFKMLMTEPNADYRFKTTIDCAQFGGIDSNSEGLHGNPWSTVSLSKDEKEVINVKIEIEFMIVIDIDNVPATLRADTKVIAVDAEDVPAGVTQPDEVIKYGTAVVKDLSESDRRIWVYIPKGMLFAVVCDDGEGNLSFFPKELVDGVSVNARLHAADKSMEVKIDKL